MKPPDYVNPLMADSLGSEYEAKFKELGDLFSRESVHLSTHQSWKGGLHIQSCGHHMHYHCRQNYCQVLKQQMRAARQQVSSRAEGGNRMEERSKAGIRRYMAMWC